MRRTVRRTTVLAAVGALALGAAACGDDDEDSGGGGGSAEPQALEMRVTESGKKATLEVPSEVKSGVTRITLSNEGENPHEGQIVRIEGDHTAEEVVEIVTADDAKIPEWIVDGGGVGTVKPGATAEAIQDLAPGNYVAFDTESDDAVTAEFTVSDEKGSDAELPSAPARIEAKDYSFETSGLKPGENVIAFENTGKELHHAILLPMTEGATLADVKEFMASDGESEGKPPVDFESGVSTAVIDGGIKQVVRLDLEAGKHVVICFIPDRAGGPPHAAKGMLNEIEVG